jgi:hypothetical protein
MDGELASDALRLGRTEDKLVMQDGEGSLSSQEEILPSNQQVGMVLLPISLECYLGSSSSNVGNPKNNADGVRLWAKYFALLGHEDGIQIPSIWTDFFTVALLNPSRFDWAKSLSDL